VAASSSDAGPLAPHEILSTLAACAQPWLQLPLVSSNMAAELLCNMMRTPQLLCRALCCACAGYDYKGYNKGGLYRFEGATSK